MTELWSWNGNELRSIVQCAERETQIGIHDFVSYTALEFVSIVNLVSSTATMVSVPALLILLLGAATIIRMFLSRMNALRGIQIYSGELRQRIGKTMYDLFSGSLTVRVFGAYDYFGDRLLRASEKEIAVQQIAMSILRTEALYRDAFEMLVTFVLIGMVQLGPKTTGAGSVQSYYNVLTDALPRIEYFTNIELKLRNHMLHLHEFGRAVNMDPEESAHESSAEPSWPPSGRIVFKRCVMRYKSGSELALNRMHFNIAPGEHIGVVGRSGAGKSSILLALMRIVDLESGAITIDGVDTSKVCLRDLRESIGVATQKDALLDGTLRSNVDPFGRFTDDEIQSTIKAAQIESTFGDLDKRIEYGGMNISAGERQLIGICRLLLRRCKIVVLDEATANIEAETARVINAVMKKRFRNSTVITIAHRLETVMNSDRVLVIDKGMVVESGRPEALTARGGAFAKLLNDERRQVS
ncbi:hypothetical protein GGI22_000327 [Coemansia erecta]|nr:hypothetical protein GGI22_000327 [Coemansia erecta]